MRKIFLAAADWYVKYTQWWEGKLKIQMGNGVVLDEKQKLFPSLWAMEHLHTLVTPQ